MTYLCADVDVPVHGREGCSVHVRKVVESMGELGLDVALLCADGGGGSVLAPPARVIEVLNSPAELWVMEAIDADASVADARMCRDLRSLLVTQAMVASGDALLRERKPAFIYERYSLFGWAGVELARRHGVPLVLEVNAPLRAEQRGYEYFVLEDTAAAIERLVLSSADVVLVVSAELAAWAEKAGADPARVHVVPNGVDGRDFAGGADAERFRVRYGLTGSVVGYVGSFQPWHDVKGLIDAFAVFRAGHPDATLLLIGDGEGRGAAADYATRRGLGGSTVFTGHLAHSEVPAALACLTAAVVPYSNTAPSYFSPMKLFESLAAGVPTIAADLGQASSLVTPGATGWLYEPGDSAGLASCLSMIVDRPEEAREIAARGRTMVMQEHTWTAITKTVLRLVQATGGNGCRQIS